MLIRSQDKKKIYNFEHIRRIFVDTNMILADDASILGEYSTEEKAIKVLDMIQNAYAVCESVRTLTSGTSIELAKHMETQEIMDAYKDIHRENFVFQMPQDSEV